MVLEPQVIDYIDGDMTTFEREPLERLSQEGQLQAYKYDGFWQCMDTMRDKMQLEEMLEQGKLRGKCGINNMDLSFYKGKTVLITGHTGFKGSWMCKVLQKIGANVVGYSLQSPTEPNLFEMAKLGEKMHSIIGDIRDLDRLNEIFDQYQPEIVIHMAAQPIVRESYVNPVYTYETNVMGTVNILEAVRLHDCVKSVINVTTDKVYRNNEWAWGYRENDILDGYDPYSNSKSCSELVTSSYKKSFFQDRAIAISTCRAGNVIGGGDFAKDRIIPDCVRAQKEC